MEGCKGIVTAPCSHMHMQWLSRVGGQKEEKHITRQMMGNEMYDNPVKSCSQFFMPFLFPTTAIAGVPVGLWILRLLLLPPQWVLLALTEHSSSSISRRFRLDTASRHTGVGKLSSKKRTERDERSTEWG